MESEQKNMEQSGVGPMLRSLRKKGKLSLRETGVHLDITGTYLSLVETGQVRASQRVIKGYMRLFDSAGEVLSGENTPDETLFYQRRAEVVRSLQRDLHQLKMLGDSSGHRSAGQRKKAQDLREALSPDGLDVVWDVGRQEYILIDHVE